MLIRSSCHVDDWLSEIGVCWNQPGTSWVANDNENFFKNLITGDETWTFGYDNIVSAVNDILIKKKASVYTERSSWFCFFNEKRIKVCMKAIKSRGRKNQIWMIHNYNAPFQASLLLKNLTLPLFSESSFSRNFLSPKVKTLFKKRCF